MGWAGSVPGHGEQEGLGERARFVRITERSSVYLEHVRGKVVREEAGKANRPNLYRDSAGTLESKLLWH